MTNNFKGFLLFISFAAIGGLAAYYLNYRVLPASPHSTVAPSNAGCELDTKIEMLITVQQYLIPGYSYEHMQGIPGATTSGFIEAKRRALSDLKPWIDLLTDSCDKFEAQEAMRRFEDELNQLDRIRVKLASHPLPALPASADCTEWTTTGDVSDTSVPCGATIPFSVVQQSGTNSANVIGNGNVVNGKKVKP